MTTLLWTVMICVWLLIIDVGILMVALCRAGRENKALRDALAGQEGRLER